MEHAIELMHGTYPTATVGTVKQIEISQEEELATLPAVTIWLQTYKIRCRATRAARNSAPRSS